MKLSRAEREEFIKQVKEQAEIAKEALQKIADLAQCKDGNVAFLARYRKDDIDTIIKCAEINR